MLLYDDLAAYWPLMSAPADYAEEAAFFVSVLREHGPDPLGSLLELGSGGGNNAWHMKGAFEHVTLVDLSPGMVEVARALNPDCEHAVGDMRSVRLGRAFDCVFVHDAICYATTLDDLRAVAQTAHVHCRPGGVAMFVPDFVRETFRSSTDHGGHDGNGRGLRYLSWTWDPDPADTTYLADYAFMLRDPDGSVRVLHDRHVEGLFPRRTWLEILTDVGFTAQVVPFRHSEVDGEIETFVGRRA